MWDYTDNYEECRHVEVTPHGVFSAVVVRDEYPSEPYNDFGCPVLQVNPRYYSADVNRMSYGDESWRRDGISDTAEDALSKFISEFGLHEGMDVFDRYLRIFHGGSAVTYDPGYHSDYYYVTYDTRAMREFWGQTGDMLETSAPEMSEWEAYIEGEVYGIRVEVATGFDVDGEPTDWSEVEDTAVWGYYGEDVAKSVAIEELGWAIERTASEMLPLGV